MKRTLPFDLHIPTPCTQSWSEMEGDARQRHCLSCKKQVHDLASLTQREIEKLVLQSDGELCGRIMHSADGSVMTQPSPPAFAAAGLVLAAAITTALPAAAQSTSSQAVVSGRVITPEGFHSDGRYGVKLSQSGAVAAFLITDSEGRWQAEVPPGVYDLQVTAVSSPGNLSIPAVHLHAGQQSFGDLRTTERIEMMTLGGIVATRTRVLFFKHPIWSVQRLFRRLA